MNKLGNVLFLSKIFNITIENLLCLDDVLDIDKDNIYVWDNLYTLRYGKPFLKTK